MSLAIFDAPTTSPPASWMGDTVSDTGTGIPPLLLEKIFDPFFTTKASGKGTGLGLSTVAAIVKSHHGFLAIETEVGRGTTFRLFFPAQLQAVAPTTRSSSPFVITARGETVLLLDDDPGVRESFRFLLEKAGYRVLAEADGRSAVATWTALARQCCTTAGIATKRFTINATAW